jgi:hypothetical protein
MNRIERRRATILDFPGFGPSTLIEGMDELSRSGFILWLWLCSQDTETLKIGRRNLAKKFGFSREHFDDVLRELRRKGYIECIAHGPYQPTTITIERKLVVKLGGNIVRATS